MGTLKTPKRQLDGRCRGIPSFPPSACARLDESGREVSLEAILSADVLYRARSLRQRVLHRREMRSNALSQFAIRVPLAPPVLRNGRYSHVRALAKPVAPDPKIKL